MEPNKGWLCPHCGKAHAPHVVTCPEPSQQKQPATSPFLPRFDNIRVGSGCATCGMHFDGALGYVCPRGDCPSNVIVGAV